MATRLPKVTFDIVRASEDMAAKGWGVRDLADASGLSVRTTYRFMAGELQTITSAAKVSKALGYSVRRYLIRSTEAA
jgi:transcriptional regulator with XRE-family HTH domain